MLRKLSYLMSAALLLAGVSAATYAQSAYRVSDREVEQLLRQLETHANSYKASLDRALDRSSYNGTSREDEINRYVSEFERATDRLKDRFSRRNSASSDVEEVINRAWAIDNFMSNNRLPGAERDWDMMRSDLQRLAEYYNVAWKWNTAGYRPPDYRDTIPGDRRDNWDRGGRRGRDRDRLTGTYALNSSASDDAGREVDRAISRLSTTDAERLRRQLNRRLATPGQIAIDQNGRQITIASSTARQVSFDANDREISETRPNGRTVRTRVSINGDRLIISSLGDRRGDYSATFEPIDNGRRLQVTRQVYTDALSQPVVVRSVYDRTSEVAQLDIYDGRGSGNDRARGDFILTDGTRLTAVLDNDLNTSETSEGERFTMTVSSPSQYNGAVIEGYIAKVDRSGRFTGRSELVLDFDRIRMRDGRNYSFTGYIDRIRTVNGDEVKVDNEGRVREDDSQTGRTVRNTGIGAAVGAILGGILGGGDGALVGAAVGGGAGAGSVILQGRDDLKLTRGAEFSITAASPRNVSSTR
jgi:hypothetical protein